MTLPTAVNDIADLSRILQENPEWREHFRALLLTPEILTQPEKMAQLTERVDGLTERMDQFILEMRDFTQEIREHNRRADARMDRFDQFSRETQEFIREMREFRAEQREINARADARMDALTVELREFIAEQRRWNEEQREINARADARMDALTAELREFIAEQRQWNEEQRRWNERQQQWNEEQRQTNAAIFARLDRIEADIQEMKADIKRLDANSQEMRADIDDIKGDLSQLKGRQAERDTHRNIVNLLQGNHPGLRRIVILKSDLIPFATELNDRIDDAEDDGLITAEERKALRAVDLVVRAIDRDTRQTVYFAVEVSRTINNHDVTRAADRAEILGRIVQEQGIGAVVGGAVIPQAVQRAQERGVSVITSNRLAG